MYNLRGCSLYVSSGTEQVPLEARWLYASSGTEQVPLEACRQYASGGTDQVPQEACRQYASSGTEQVPLQAGRQYASSGTDEVPLEACRQYAWKPFVPETRCRDKWFPMGRARSSVRVLFRTPRCLPRGLAVFQSCSASLAPVEREGRPRAYNVLSAKRSEDKLHLQSWFSAKSNQRFEGQGAA